VDPRKYWKAIAGAVAGALSALVAVAADDVITKGEWYAVLGALVFGSGLVYAAPANK
jgi:hypothetical protein